MFVYIKSQPMLFTVGFYDPKGEWHPIEDFEFESQARDLCHYLNGGS